MLFDVRKFLELIVDALRPIIYEECQRAMGYKSMDEVNKARQKHYVYGLRGIRQLFNVSHKTAQIYKNTFLAPACYQQGRTIMVDADKAIELFKNREGQI